MKIKHLLRLFAGILFIHLSANATTTIGEADCGKWVAEKSPGRKAWLLGYITGLNVLWSKEKKSPADPLNIISSADQAFLWMDNYCKENPLNMVGDGGYILFLDLINKSK